MPATDREVFGPRAPPITCLPTIELSQSTVERLDDLRVEGESDDEIVTELVNIYEAENLTLSDAGDHVGGE